MFQMMQRAALNAPPVLLVLALPLLACTGQVGGGGKSPGGDKGSPTQPGGAGSGPGAGGNGGSGNNPPVAMPPVGAPATTSAIPACQGEERPGPRRLRLLTRAEYAQSVADLLSIPVPPVDNLPVQTIVDGFDNNAGAGAVTSRHVDEFLATGERAAAQAIMTSRWKLATCPAGNGCDRTFVTSFGRRVFRRPLTEGEITRHLALFDPAVTGGVFEKGMELVIRAMLSAPSFLYRSELGEKAADGSYKLGPYEVATALSYFFWGTTPDDTLLNAAQSGQLATPEGIEAQATRLLNDQRSRPAVVSFFRQWLGADGFLFTNKDTAIYPTFTDAIRKSMVAELDAFAANVVFNGTGKFPELFTADYVFADQALGGFYGLAGGGATVGKLPVTATPERTRGGLLTLGAVLGTHAHSNESSPVRRGLFVRSRLLCQTLPSPPMDIDTTPPGLDPSLTTRARFAKHSSEPACAGCHRLIDPLGFGFERYDGVGAYRATEHGMPVDPSGDVMGLEEMNNGKSNPFSGLIDLGRIISTSPNAQACFARQLFRYARGGEGEADACAVARLQTAFKESGFDIKRLLVEVVKGKSFLTRN